MDKQLRMSICYTGKGLTTAATQETINTQSPPSLKMAEYKQTEGMAQNDQNLLYLP